MTPIRLPIFTPVVCLQTARSVLGVSEDKVLRLVEDGSLMAWDLRSPGSKRELLRILTLSLRSHSDGLGAIRPNDTEALSRLVPWPSPTVLASRLASNLVVSSTHIANLVREGSLQAATKRIRAKDSLPILRESAVAFLTKRAR